MIGRLFWGGDDEKPYRRSMPEIEDDYVRPIDEPATVPDPRPALAAIRAADPAFDPQRLLDRVQSLFFGLKRAWQARDAAPARPFMSAGMFDNFSAQIDAMRKNRIRNVLEDLHVLGTHVVAADHGEQGDRITVRIDAGAAHYAVADSGGELVFGSHQPVPLTEYWTLERPAGVRTPGTGGSSAPQCPNCGAPLTSDAAGRCHYCNAPIKLAGIDWIISRISETYELH